MMLKMVGKNIGRYRLDEIIGEGGMAAVYKAFDTRLERWIAIKVLRPYKEQDADFPLRFEREAKALAKMAHANIVKVYDYGDQDGMLYLVMEFLPGGTLKQRLGKPISYHESSTILIPVARALGYAHKHKVIHRDVKPTNILFDEAGDPVISDFGIAKVIAEGMPDGNLTGTGAGIGTPDYMAPEQGLGGKIDHRADIYALGVVLFEMLTGRKPFVSDNPMAVMIKHVSAAFPHPSQVIPELAGPIEEMLLKTTQKNPDDRFQSMEDFAAEMEKLANFYEGKLEEVAKSSVDQPFSKSQLPPTAQRPSAPQPLKTEIIPPPSRPGAWQIIITSGSLSGTSHLLGEKCSIGRSKENDIQVADTNSSRNHAIIEKVSAGFLLTDLKSTNGTTLNGKKISKPTLLNPGDKLIIGDTQFTIYADLSTKTDKDEKTAPWEPSKVS
jgi:serine/threonine protein kinase